MSKVNNTESFDGIPVTAYDASFSGKFDLPDDVGEKMRQDDVVTFLVSGVVEGANMTATKLGDLKRTNKIKVIASREIDEKAARIIEQQLSAPRPSTPGVYQPTLADDEDEA
jgi:hypothetical protein